MLIVRILQWFVQFLPWLHVDGNERLQRNGLLLLDVCVLHRFVQLLPRVHVSIDRILQRVDLFVLNLR